MVKKPRENRIPIMMSDDELKVIDDWRFANRVATRSDAVRRLCYLGLLLERVIPPVLETAVQGTKKIASMPPLPPSDEDGKKDIRGWVAAALKNDFDNREFRLTILLELAAVVSEASMLRIPDTKEALAFANSIRHVIETLGLETEAGRDRLTEFLRAVVSPSKPTRTSDPELKE